MTAIHTILADPIRTATDARDMGGSFGRLMAALCPILLGKDARV